MELTDSGIVNLETMASPAGKMPNPETRRHTLSTV